MPPRVGLWVQLNAQVAAKREARALDENERAEARGLPNIYRHLDGADASIVDRASAKDRARRE
eukprot:2067689-Prymnesium_polylepis.1